LDRFAGLPEILFRSYLIGNVSGNAACVDETVTVPSNVRVDQDVTDRTVPGMQSRRITPQGFPGLQTLQDVLNNWGIRVKFGDVMTDVLFLLVPQQIEFSLIGPKDSSISRDPVQADRGVLNEVGKILVALLQAGRALSAP
jgi:hypothetical protein